MAITLEQASLSLGRLVIYQSHPGAEKEEGKITLVNDQYIMVLFKGDLTSKAVRPEDLTFL